MDMVSTKATVFHTVPLVLKYTYKGYTINRFCSEMSYETGCIYKNEDVWTIYSPRTKEAIREVQGVTNFEKRFTLEKAVNYIDTELKEISEAINKLTQKEIELLNLVKNDIPFFGDSRE